VAFTKAYTIGFTGKTAQDFFGLLKRNGIQRLLDVRLNNTSQLSGFTKKHDLSYFVSELVGAEYVHEPLLAPTSDILKSYQNRDFDWDEYTRRFLVLMRDRSIEQRIPRLLFDRPTVLLCSEPTAERCHRRLVVEYLARAWGDLEAVHL
jgi:uncharacterized protein (DUF488 family)